MKPTQEQAIHLQRFGRFWDPESMSFVSSDAVMREPETSRGSLTLSKPVHPEAYLFRAAIARAQDPEPKSDPELEEGESGTGEPGVAEKLIKALAGLIEKQSREPQLIQLEPQINVIIPETPVTVSVEMPSVEETLIVDRDQEGFISKIQNSSKPLSEAAIPPERPGLQDLIRDRMGLKRK